MHAKTLVSTVGLSEEDWLGYRTRGIGGSDIAAIAGYNPFKSRVQVYLEKVGAAIDVEENQAMRWGKLLEPVIAKQFSKQTGLALEPVDAILQHPEHDWALANLDSKIIHPTDGEGILEVKNTSAYLAKAWEDDNVPMHYLMQLQWYFAVTGATWGYFAPLIGGNNLLIDKRIQRDEEIIQPMLKIASDFWTMVQMRTPPAPDGSEASTELMKLLYRNADEGKVIELGPEWEADYKKLLELDEEMKAFEKDKQYEIDAIKNRFKAEMQDASAASIGGQVVVTWKQISKAAYEVKAQTYRSFLTKKPKTIKEKK